MNYNVHKTIEGSFENVRQRAVETLKEEGFDVLTEIDVRETLKGKLDWISGSIRFLAPAILLLPKKRCRPHTIQVGKRLSFK